jgi:phage-related protein
MASAEVIVRAIDQASGVLRQIAGSVDGLEKKTNALQGGMARLSGGVNSLVKGLGGLAVAAGAAVGVNELKNAFFSTAQAAAEAQRSAALFNFYMKELKVDANAATAIVNRLQKEFGVVPAQAQEAIQVLVKQGASLKQVAEVLPAIAASASAAGANVGDAMVQAARGIAMSRSELVEYAGISSNFGPEQQKFAKATKTKVEALTEEQKITANINAVLRESQIELKAYRATSDPAARSANDLAAAQKNLSLAIGQFTLPYLIKYQEAVTAVVRNITAWVQSEQFKKLAQDAQPYIKLLSELVTAAWGAISAAWNNVLKPALNAIAPLLKAVLGNVADILRALTALFQGDFGKVAELVKGIFSRTFEAIKQTVGNIAPIFLEAGRNAVAGLIRGITERVNDAVDAAKRLGQSVIDAAKKVLRISSPSREFMFLGFMVVDGFTQGILDRIEAQESKLIARFGKTSEGIQAEMKRITQNTQAELMRLDFEAVNAEWDRFVYSQIQKAESWARAWQESSAAVKGALGGMPGAPALDIPAGRGPQLQMQPLTFGGPVLQPIGQTPVPLDTGARLDLTPPSRGGGIPFITGVPGTGQQPVSLPMLGPVFDVPLQPVGRELGVNRVFEFENATFSNVTVEGTTAGPIVGELGPENAPRTWLDDIAAMLGPFAGLANIIPGLLGPLQAFSQLLEQLNPVASLVAGAMEVLGPAVQEFMAPMVELGSILARLITPVFQALAPILKLAALMLGGFVLIVAKAWNALAWIIEKITFGAVRLFVDDKAIEDSLRRIQDGSEGAAKGLERLSNSVNLVSGYGFTGVALSTAGAQQPVIVVNVSGALDPYRTEVEVQSYRMRQYGRADR